MKKNDIVELTIESLSSEGRGLAKYNDKLVFVRDALPGEKVKAEVLAVHENTMAAKSVEIVKASPDRVQGDNEKWANNGYARLANYKYDKQLEFKKSRIEQLLKKNEMDDVTVNDVIPSPKKLTYRNELVLPVREINGQLEVGFYEPRTAKFIPLNSYLIANENVAQAILGVRDILRKLKVSAYNPETNTGFIRDIDVRRSHSNNGMIVTLVTHENDHYDLPEIVGLVTQTMHNINGIVLNYNPHKPTDVTDSEQIFGKSNIPIWGDDYVEDTINDMTFKVSPKSFFQANGSQLQTIMDLALNLADLHPDDKLIDAYCGVGTLGLLAAKDVASVRGIENAQVTIEDARANAKKNKIDNITFYNGSVEQILARFAKNGENTDVIITAPPVKGLSQGFIDAAVEMKPRRIVYGSANPDTMVRDLKRFKNSGYTTSKLLPIDTSPQTPDLKCFCVLTPAK